MTMSKLMKALFAACISVMLASQPGCFPSDLTPIDNPIDIINNNGTNQQTPPPAGSQTPVLTVTSLLNDITVAQGQPVLLTWQIQDLPDTPTLDVVYRATTEQTDKMLISGLPTSNVGSLQIDTYSLVPGLKYIITLNLKSGGTIVSTAQAVGRITIGTPKLTIKSPLNDTILLPSSLMTINWEGNFLPADSSIQTFLDIDTTYSNGNEIIVKTDSFPTGGSLGTGSITLNAANLWNNADVKRSLQYYLGVRIVKNGQIAIASYASATVKLFGGEGFNITTPIANEQIRAGDSVNVRWTTAGVPNNLTVKIVLVDRDNANEIPMAGTLAVTAGGTTLNTLGLVTNHTYDILVKLFENDTVIAIRKASGSVTATTQGSSIFINNPELISASSVVYLGLENTYTITWTINNTPVNSKVSLFLDEDGNMATTNDQIEVTPDGGVDSTLKQFALTPTAADFTGFTGRKFVVIANLITTTGDLYAQDSSEGKIRIGDGGIQFTAPAANVDLLMGDTTDITWDNTGGICAKFPGRQKTIRLYVDETDKYDVTTSKEITPVGGLDTCAVQTFTFDPSTLTEPLNGGTSYYIIARLTVEGNTEDETQVVAVGQVSVAQVELTVNTPTFDVTDNFSNIAVTWTTTGLNTTGKKVRFFAAEIPDAQISAEYNADAESGTVDGSKLPPGTYTIRGEVFGIADDGSEVTYAAGNALGKIVRPDGYDGIYLLSDMAAVTQTAYSPVDGTIFEGENIGDLAGYDLAGLGDLDNDGYSEFVICSRYGKVNNSVKPGSAYLIYGKNNFDPVDSLKFVANESASKTIDGTLILLPMENAAMDLGGGNLTGDFSVTAVPDASADGLADLMVACPTAMPLLFTFTNNDTTNAVTFIDYYGNERTLAANTSIGEFAHVFPFFRMTSPEPKGTITLAYGFDYYPGNTIDVQFNPIPPEVGSGHTMDITIVEEIIDEGEEGEEDDVTADVRNQRGTCYLLTSERLKKYRNKPFNMVLVGSPVQIDAEVASELDQMFTWTRVSGKFGFNIGFLPDMSDNGRPEFVITTPNDAPENYTSLPLTPRDQAGVATIFDVETRGNGYNTNGTTWYYWGNVDALTTGRLMPFRPAYAFGYFGSPTTSNSQSLIADIIGTADNAALTTVSGLGKTTSTQFIGGDFDDNGDFDIIAGVPGENGGEGAIYVLNLPRFMYYFTVPLIDLAKFMTPVDPLADPNFEIPVTGVKITGGAGEGLGSLVKAIGDFNGDGLSDFVIAMPGKASTGGQANAGRIAIVFGKANIPPSTIALNTITSAEAGPAGLNALIFESTAVGDRLGEKVCSVQDINGDGYDDIIVAAPTADNGAIADCGKIYLIYGRNGIVKTNAANMKTYVDYDNDRAADDIWPISVIGTTLSGATFVGEAAGDKLQSVSRAGDVNGDGVEDFLFGAPFADSHNGLQNTGKAYLVYGRQFTWPANNP